MRDVAESIRFQLRKRIRDTGQSHAEQEQYFYIERLLYRLSQSSYAKDFILKGALALSMIHVPSSRPTRDVDLLGRVDNDPEYLKKVFQEVCIHAVEVDDGFDFDPKSVTAERIAEADEYSGVRVIVKGSFGSSRVQVQVDIGIGDSVFPEAVEERPYPTILETLPAPILVATPRSRLSRKSTKQWSIWIWLTVV